MRNQTTKNKGEKMQKDRIQKLHLTNGTKYKHDKIKMRHNTK